MDMNIIEANPGINRHQYDKIVRDRELKRDIGLIEDNLVNRNIKFYIASYDYILYLLYQPHYRKYNKISVYRNNKWRDYNIDNCCDLHIMDNIKFLIYNFVKYNRIPIRIRLFGIYQYKICMDYHLQLSDYIIFNITNWMKKKYNNIYLAYILEYIKKVPLSALFQHFTEHNRDNTEIVKLYIIGNENIVCGKELYNIMKKNKCDIEIISDNKNVYLEIREKY